MPLGGGGELAGRLLGSHGCRFRSRGVWLGLYCINLFVVWVECVKALLVNVCYGTAKSTEIVSRDMCESQHNQRVVQWRLACPLIQP